MLKVQEAGNILRIGFALLKCPHIHRAYLVIERFDLILAIGTSLKCISYNGVVNTVKFGSINLSKIKLEIVHQACSPLSSIAQFHRHSKITIRIQ